MNGHIVEQGGVLYFHGQTFHYDVPGYARCWWDINLAREEADAGHLVATAEIDRDQMQEISERNEFDEAKVELVDDSLPGIGAPLRIPPQFGTGIAYILIDGTHRCIKALRHGRIFKARLLTDEAADRCWIAGDERLRP